MRLRFVLPKPALAQFVTAYYLMEVSAPDGGALVDYLHPEWANLRFFDGGTAQAGIGPGPSRAVPPFVVTGPTSQTTRFSVGEGRIWGIGLLPLGWCKFVDASASDHADKICDGSADPAFAAFHSLSNTLYDGEADPEAEVARIERHLESLLDRPIKRADRVQMLHQALVDPDVTTVAELADRTAMTMRSLERLSTRRFGFTPKLLLRRQRFLRSLAQFMIDPSLSWLKTLDTQYHDQAHFVRDFRQFMTMTPSEYGKIPHPILYAAAVARTQAVGAAVQGLHIPATE